MAAHSGEKAQKTGDSYRAKCDDVNCTSHKGTRPPSAPMGTASSTPAATSPEQVRARRRITTIQNAVQKAEPALSNVVPFTRVGRSRCASRTD